MPVRAGPGAMNAGRALILLDAAMAASAWAAALRLGCGPGACLAGATAANAVAAVAYPAANLASLYALGLYRREAMAQTRESVGRVPLAASLGAIAAALGMALASQAIGQPPDKVRLFSGAVLAFCLSGTAARVAFSALRRRGAFDRRILVAGTGQRAWDMLCMLRNEGSRHRYRLRFVAQPDAPGPGRLGGERAPDVSFAATGDMLAEAEAFDPDEVVVARDERRGAAVDGLVACKRNGYPVTQYMEFLERELRRIDVRRADANWMLHSGGFRAGPAERAAKRAFDVVASAAMLAALSPVIALAAAAIKSEDGGPAIYGQDRVTQRGRVFRIHKMRTMRTDAERHGAVWAQRSDPRITRVGSFLRKARIDEIPQLLNVLRGEMSMVGPRPERPSFVEELGRQLPLYHERHMAKAGLTGWAQVNYPYGASLDDARSKLSYDLYYVKNQSLMLDALILLQTVRVVLWGSGAR